MKYFLFICTILIIGCTPPKASNENVQLVIERIVNNKLSKSREKRLIECKQEMFTQINNEVDSIMFDLVRKSNGKNEKIKARPPRPKRPVDTIKLEKFDD